MQFVILEGGTTWDERGRLAGGVAHDFNNLLGAITGYGELLRRDVGPDHPGFGRVAEMVREVLNASSEQPGAPR